MLHILHIDSSPQAESVSRTLTAELVQAVSASVGQAAATYRDLAADGLPHLTRDGVVPIRTAEAATPAQQASRTLSDALIAELEAAALLVIGAPMYNFGITTQLKAWFDHVLRAGRTFRYTPNGPAGLLQGKRAVVIETRGGVYSRGPAQAMDHQEPHLRTLLGFMGITDVAFIRAEGLGTGPDSRAQGIGAARQEIASLAGTLVPAPAAARHAAPQAA